MLIKKMKVQEIAGQIRGVSYKPEDIKNSLDNNSVILLRANNIDNGRINFDEVIYVDKRKVSENQYLQRDDILICTSSGSRHLVGKAASVDFDKPCTFGAFCRVIRPQSIIGEYLGLYFQSNIYKRNILKSAIGANINNLRTEHISSLELPVYDYKVRMKIIRRIRLIQSIIFYRQTELVALDKLIKARFVEMFGSIKEEQMLGEISEFITVGIANSATHAYAATGVPMLRNQNIKENYLDDSDLIYITPEFAEKYKSKKLKENDIIAMRTGYPGIACLVPKKYEGCQTFTTLIVRLKINHNANYVCSYINSDLGKRFIDSEKVGVAQQNVGAKSLAQMPIKIASKDLQDKFGIFVQQVNKSKFASHSN